MGSVGSVPWDLSRVDATAHGVPRQDRRGNQREVPRGVRGKAENTGEGFRRVHGDSTPSEGHAHLRGVYHARVQGNECVGSRFQVPRKRNTENTLSVHLPVYTA